MRRGNRPARGGEPSSGGVGLRPPGSGDLAAGERVRRPPGGDAPAEIAPDLTAAERAAALSGLGGAAPAGAPLDAGRLDAARARLRAAATPPDAPALDADPGRFDAAQARLRAARPGRRKPA